MQLSDVYSLWSATNIVQMVSAHTKDPKELKGFLKLGQKAHFNYMPRRPNVRPTGGDHRTKEVSQCNRQIDETKGR